MVRVGTFTNYEFTPAEKRQLEAFRLLHPEDRFFINTNSITPVNHNPGVPVVFTLNGDLHFHEPAGPALDELEIPWVRIKWVYNAKVRLAVEFRKAVRWAEARGIRVVCTIMRFTNKRDLEACVDDPYECYRYKSGYYWPREKPPTYFTEQTQHHYVCDEIGGGCPACGWCSTLTFSLMLPVYGLDLEASLPEHTQLPNPSGAKHCVRNCLSCYAAACQTRGGGRPKTNIIRQNQKQQGRIVTR